MDLPNALPRVKKFLNKRFNFIKGLLRRYITDPRDDRGKRRDHIALLHAIFAALLAGCRTPRAAEELSEFLYIPDSRRKDGKSGRIPDTTLYEFLPKLRWEEFTPVLVDQVRAMKRKGELVPVGLPCGVAVVDGKSFGKILHDADGAALKQSSENGQTFYHVRVLRSVLSSSAAKVAIGQGHIKADEGETTAFRPFAAWLWKTYGRHGLFEILDVDAGFLSRENFGFVDQTLQCGLIAALKGNQPDLYAQARRVLIPLWRSLAPEAQTPWEPIQGKQLRRSLYRTSELNDFLEWNNLRQTWLVVQETREKVALTSQEYQQELEQQQAREKRKRKRLTNPRLLLPVLQTGQSPLDIPELAALLKSKSPLTPAIIAPGQPRKSKKQSKASASVDVVQNAPGADGVAPSATAPSTPPRKKKSLKIDSFARDTDGKVEERLITDDGYLVTVVLRLFITNLPSQRLTPSQILSVVRNHWAVENDCFHSLDVQWREDAPAWCTAGQALLSLGMLRLLAYNYAQQLRKKHMRMSVTAGAASQPRPWQRLFTLIKEALKDLFPLALLISPPIPGASAAYSGPSG